MTIKYTPERQKKDKNIVFFVENRNIDFTNFSRNIEDKIVFLEQGMQYKSLRTGAGNNYTEIRDCSEAQINSVVRDTYNAAKKRLDKYGVQLSLL
jgi:hypothetical protein